MAGKAIRWVPGEGWLEGTIREARPAGAIVLVETGTPQPVTKQRGVRPCIVVSDPDGHRRPAIFLSFASCPLNRYASAGILYPPLTPGPQRNRQALPLH